MRLGARQTRASARATASSSPAGDPAQMPIEGELEAAHPDHGVVPHPVGLERRALALGIGPTLPTTAAAYSPERE